MRKRIHLSGRKELSKGAFALSLEKAGEKPVAVMALLNPAELKSFPPDTEIRVKFVENKQVEVLSFGTVAKPHTSVQLSQGAFRAPSCQVRLVSRESSTKGKLLGSTPSWTLRAGGDPDGILLFQPAKIQPRLWKLEIRQGGDEHPILYVDERIPDASLWAKTDSLFAACVLPHVVGEVMREILAAKAPPEDGWAADWVHWASILMPGSKPPYILPESDQREWIDELLVAFAAKNDLAENALRKIGESL